jgi:hypothetical protein
MIFDSLRAIAGNWLSEIQPLVDMATLLHLPITPHEVLPRHQDLETMSDISIHFRLPHPVTAIEDNASCILLIDPEPDLKGLDEQRVFIECVPLAAEESAYNDTQVDRSLCESVKTSAGPGMYAISLGRISSPAQRAGSWLAQGELLWVVTGTPVRQHTTASNFLALPELVVEAMTQAAMRNAMTAIEELIAFGTRGAANG